jgi:C1A family cysteine protease
LGAVTSVKDQGACGGCWAFSVTGALEGQWFLKTGNLISLSAQNLIDCSSVPPYYNLGCMGGDPWQAFYYIQQAGGVNTESSYPYTSGNTSQVCRFKRKSEK